MSRSVQIVPILLLLSACAARPTSSEGVVGAREPVAEPRAPVQNPSDEATAASLEVTPPSDDDLICRRESVTGSLQKRQVCATRAERRERRLDAQEWYRSGGLRGTYTRVPSVR